jgi:HPt (histidine-containing phosphotransfer) domain-containing protein
MNSTPSPFPEDAMKKFRDEYVNTFPEKLRLLQGLIDEMKQAVHRETLQTLRLHIHKIAGSSGTYGFSDLSLICKEFEGVILQKMEILKDDIGDSNWVAEFMPYVDKIRKELANVNQH